MKTNSHAKANFKYKIINILVILLFLLVIIATIIMFNYKFSQNANYNILNKLNQIIILPNEEPIIESIDNAEGLKGESPFYADVEHGDKIFIFPKAHRIIIYREKDNKIINVGPIVDE